MEELSYKIISDEGIKKLTKITVKNAKSKSQAKNIAFAICNSHLLKLLFLEKMPIGDVS